MFGRKRWICFEDAIRPYEDHCSVDFGIAWVNPKDIIGLSLKPKDVRNSEKLKRLRDSVKLNGWTNESPFTLHLFKLPNGKFTVANGGNHRAYLSNQLNISRIQALVTIVIPINLISEENKSQLEIFKKEEREYDMKAKKVNDFLKTKGIYRGNHEAEEALFDKYCRLADTYLDKQNYLLLEIASQLGYLTDTNTI